jgi:nucleoside-diphosphate-sugar epimerase
MSGKIVAVTGASGFVAGVLIDELTRRGYHVRGTVRSLKDKEKVGHLQSDFPKLELFEADLLTPNSFDKVVDGVEIVFHTASPFQLKVEDPQRDLVDPAVKGTENVLNSALKSASVKTIVVTSSVAAVRNNKTNFPHYTEEDWNTVATIESQPYPYSKVMAERKAWELVDAFNASSSDRKVKLVTINPTLVLGPVFGTRVDGTSVSTIVKLMDGTFVKEGGAPPNSVPCVDVRDVAKAHVEAAERPEATGRFIVSSRDPYTNEEYAAALLKANPDLKDQIALKHRESATPLPPQWGVDTTKAETVLGIKFIPMEKTLADMSKKLLELGLVKKL